MSVEFTIADAPDSPRARRLLASVARQMAAAESLAWPDASPYSGAQRTHPHSSPPKGDPASLALCSRMEKRLKALARSFESQVAIRARLSEADERERNAAHSAEARRIAKRASDETSG